MACKLKAPVRCGVIGYGGAFNMGLHHSTAMKDTGRMQVVAVCDVDKARLEIARQQLGDVKLYESVAKMARDPEIDLCVVVTPHNVHASCALACLRGGKHIVIEKPFAITIKECTDMITVARKNGLCLTAYHNRRHDGDFVAVREALAKGLIGDVFHVEAAMGGYGKPGAWWRSQKEISGGAFYDWGAHCVDWVLHFVPGKMTTVSGQFQKRVWMDVTNEDHCEAYVRFDSGASAVISMSSICAKPRPRWYILGTQGAIVDSWSGSFRVHKRVDGYIGEFDVPYQKTNNTYYADLAAHLLDGKPLTVTPESARRVIAVIELSERASKTGREQRVPYEDEVV